MSNLKLDAELLLDIPENFIEKYNIREGTLSPFTRLEVVDIENLSQDKVSEEVDIKRPGIDIDIDIKKAKADDNDNLDVDIKKPAPEEDIDIKKINK